MSNDARSLQVGVPPHHVPVMVALANVTEHQFDELADVLGRASETARLSDVIAAVAASSPDLELDPAALVTALIGAESVRVWRGVGLDEATGLISDSPSLDLEAEDRETLRTRIRQLLESPVLEVLSKALDLLTEEDKVYIDSRVVTDIRPVFRGETFDDPAGVVLIQTLRIEYQAEGSRNSIYLALDRSDLEQLQRVVKRALNKSDAIAERVGAAGLPIIDFDDDLEGET